ncbi:hypothetical protein [Desulfurobacterium sp.]
MDDIKELVLKHEREISQLIAIQNIMVEQVNKTVETLNAVKEAIAEVKIALEEQRKELKTAIEIRDKLEEVNQNLVLEKNQQKQTNKRIFERIESLESNMREVRTEIKKLSESTEFARWLDGGFKVASKKAAVFVLFALGLMILGAFLGIDLHHLLRR